MGGTVGEGGRMAAGSGAVVVARIQVAGGIIGGSVGRGTLGTDCHRGETGRDLGKEVRRG